MNASRDTPDTSSSGFIRNGPVTAQTSGTQPKLLIDSWNVEGSSVRKESTYVQEDLPVLLLDEQRTIIERNIVARPLFTLGRKFSSYLVESNPDLISTHLQRLATTHSWTWSTLVITDERSRKAYDWQFFLPSSGTHPSGRAPNSSIGLQILAIGRPLSFDERARVFARTYRLTPREAEVMRLLIEGYTNLNISARLGISENTVRSHARTIYSRMLVASRVELMRLLIA